MHILLCTSVTSELFCCYCAPSLSLSLSLSLSFLLIRELLSFLFCCSSLLMPRLRLTKQHGALPSKLCVCVCSVSGWECSERARCQVARQKVEGLYVESHWWDWVNLQRLWVCRQVDLYCWKTQLSVENLIVSHHLLCFSVWSRGYINATGKSGDWDECQGKETEEIQQHMCGIWGWSVFKGHMTGG